MRPSPVGAQRRQSSSGSPLEQRRVVPVVQVDQAVIGGHGDQGVVRRRRRQLQQQRLNLLKRSACLRAGDAVGVAGAVVVGDVPVGDGGCRTAAGHAAQAAHDAALRLPQRPVSAGCTAAAQIAVEGAHQVYQWHVYLHVAGDFFEARWKRPDLRGLNAVPAQLALRVAFQEWQHGGRQVVLRQVCPPAGNAVLRRPTASGNRGHGAGGGCREYRVQLQPYPCTQIGYPRVGEGGHAHAVDQHQRQVAAFEQVTRYCLTERAWRFGDAGAPVHRTDQIDERGRRGRGAPQRAVGQRRFHDGCLPGWSCRRRTLHACPGNEPISRADVGVPRATVEVRCSPCIRYPDLT